MGCIKITSQVPDRCISVTSQVPDNCISVTSTEQNGECNIPIPVPNWELIDSGYGDAEYDNYGNEIIYENRDIKINITNLSYIVDIGLKYTIGVGGGELVSIDEHSGIVVWHTPNITNGSWTTEEISFSVSYSDDCFRYSNRTYAYKVGSTYIGIIYNYYYGFFITVFSQMNKTIKSYPIGTLTGEPDYWTYKVTDDNKPPYGYDNYAKWRGTIADGQSDSLLCIGRNIDELVGNFPCSEKEASNYDGGDLNNNDNFWTIFTFKSSAKDYIKNIYLENF